MPNENTKSGYGILMAIVLVWIAANIFLSLDIETQRKMFFTVVHIPAVPKTTYCTTIALSSTIERNILHQATYVATIKRNDNDIYARTKDNLDPGVFYTVECSPHFYDFCSALTTDHDYLAGWSSSTHDEIAITELKTNEKATYYADETKTRIFKVRGWKKTE
jgi:hypothetical protein